MTNKELKEIRDKKIKYNKILPEFHRYNWDRYFKLERQDKWRHPRGIDNKTRLGLRGYPKLVKIGYRKPKNIRNLHSSGLLQLRISTLRDLERIDNELKSKVIVTIDGRIGLKKKMEIINKAKELGIEVTNGEY
ncbi:50S ribosomal protein L32 [Candidatus Acidianus copahuensis]|uniref:Large ribosomal subunit protein eL32 n=1 Tax=Candidatus Acidianus copahuensis TaxID=1160895 RepID=A0A031LME1_9CREN|nr:50S ribosomal protein L32e [Candidatus Acidianus copahuensis]EZQ03846.1 50S ribosomal protein L32 [Candidatus Acidianus copahuensis]